MVKFLEDKASWDAAIETNKSNGKLLVVDFTAKWCGPCQKIAPKIKALAKHYNDTVVVVKVDVDDNDEVAQLCKVKAMPTFQLFLSGKRVEEFSGANCDKLTKLIEKHLPVQEEKTEDAADDEVVVVEQVPP